MMEWTLIGWDGSLFTLPEPTEWALEYTAGTPCDSFFLRCPWEPGGLDEAGGAVRLRVHMDGQVRFYGVVDEVERGAGADGGWMEVSGRGMAALLLDNEAMPADYQTATAEDILRDHVRPYGIEVGETGSLPAVSPFSVRSGESEWQVLYRFARYYGGVTPRFDRAGLLLLTPFQDREEIVLDGGAAVTGIRWRAKRYGVLSEIWVRDKTRLCVEKVENAGFSAQGGQCRRVMTMPGRSNYLAMRYSGEFQLSRSESGRNRVEVTVAQLFYAWPGDLVRLDWPGWGCNGVWRVLEARVEAGEAGGRTALTLGEIEAVL